jgi:hypothetical protein
LQTSKTFGRRTEMAEALPRPKSYPEMPDNGCESFPFSASKNIGLPLPTALGCSLLGIAFTAFPALTQRLSGPELLHSAILPALIMPGIMAILYFSARTPAKLDVSSAGILVCMRGREWFYNWADIDSVSERKAGVQLALMGRSDAQNAYNIISSRFGLSQSDLSSLITAGIHRFGGAPFSRLTPTVAPGDDLNAAQKRSFLQITRNFSLLFGALFLLFAVQIGWQSIHDIELQKVGQRTVARVISIYTGTCGKRGCNTDVEYAFTAPSPSGAREYHGYKTLSFNGRTSDPNLIYAKENGSVPIAYDPGDPTNSALNFDDRVFRVSPMSNSLTVLGIFAGVFGGVMVLILGGMAVSTFSARNRA